MFTDKQCLSLGKISLKKLGHEPLEILYRNQPILVNEKKACHGYYQFLHLNDPLIGRSQLKFTSQLLYQFLAFDMKTRKTTLPKSTWLWQPWINTEEEYLKKIISVISFKIIINNK